MRYEDDVREAMNVDTTPVNLDAERIRARAEGKPKRSCKNASKKVGEESQCSDQSLTSKEEYHKQVSYDVVKVEMDPPKTYQNIMTRFAKTTIDSDTDEAMEIQKIFDEHYKDGAFRIHYHDDKVFTEYLIGGHPDNVEVPSTVVLDTGSIIEYTGSYNNLVNHHAIKKAAYNHYKSLGFTQYRINKLLRNAHITPTIVIINGSGGSGKDTFVDKCDKAYPEYVYIKNISTIDPVRKAAEQIIGKEEGKKDNGYRTLLSDIKKAWVKYNQIGPCMYARDIIYTYKNAYLTRDEDGNEFYDYFRESVGFDKPEIFFIHVREPEEIDLFKKFFDNIAVYTVLVAGARSDPETFTNTSDQNVYHFDYDYIIYNNGTERDLEKHAERFIYDIVCRRYDENPKYYIPYTDPYV